QPISEPQSAIPAPSKRSVAGVAAFVAPEAARGEPRAGAGGSRECSLHKAGGAEGGLSAVSRREVLNSRQNPCRAFYTPAAAGDGPAFAQSCSRCAIASCPIEHGRLA